MVDNQYFFTFILFVVSYVKFQIFKASRRKFLAAEKDESKSKVTNVLVFGTLLWYNLLFLVVIVVHLFEMICFGKGFILSKFFKLLCLIIKLPV
jgi:hypothetical protein